MQKHEKIFIPGGTGMVGNAIIQKLIEKGYDNIIANYHKRPPLKYKDKVQFFKLDLTRQSEVEDFFETHKPHYVFLAAAKVGGIVANNTYKAEFIYDNIAISLHIIHASYKYGVKKLLNLGSSCIYPKLAPQPMKEEYLLSGFLEPTNEAYAIAKIAAIKLCRYYNEQYGTNFISVMPTNLYGPNDNFDLFTSHVLPALIRKFHLGKCLEDDNWDAIKKDLNLYPIENIDGNATEKEIIAILDQYGIRYQPFSKKANVEVWGSGNVYREFLHVEDMAEACIHLMEHIQAKELKSLSPDYFVNIGTGVDIQLKELVLLIKEIIGFTGEIYYNTSKPDGTPRKLLDVSKIKELGWEPKIELREGIKSTYKWYVENVLN